MVSILSKSPFNSFWQLLKSLKSYIYILSIYLSTFPISPNCICPIFFCILYLPYRLYLFILPFYLFLIYAQPIHHLSYLSVLYACSVANSLLSIWPNWTILTRFNLHIPQWICNPVRACPAQRQLFCAAEQKFISLAIQREIRVRQSERERGRGR